MINAQLVGFGQASGCLAQIQTGRIADILSLIDAAIALGDATFNAVNDDPGLERQLFEAVTTLRNFRALGVNAVGDLPAKFVWDSNVCAAIDALKRLVFTVPGFSARIATASQTLDREINKPPTPPRVVLPPSTSIQPSVIQPSVTSVIAPAVVPSSRVGLIIGLIGAALAVVVIGGYLLRRESA